MSDVVDVANKVVEQQIENKLHERKKVFIWLPRGVCNWCEEPVPSMHKFCDTDCRNDAENHRAARQRNGRV